MAMSSLLTAAAVAPGIFWANSGVTAPYKDILPYSTYVKWYETVHIPDWMGAKEGAITAAWRYQCLDTTRQWPFLVTYKYPDITAMNDPAFRNVTLNSNLLPEGGPVTKFVQFQGISGPHLETWRAGSTGDDRGPLMVSEAIDPPANMTADQFNEWFTTSYIYEVSALEGWRRTSRFDNGMGTQARNGGQPRWLAIHEFEDWSPDLQNITTKMTTLLGKSDKTKAFAASAKRLDIAPWKLMRVYGDGTTPWGNIGEDHIL